MKQFFEILMKDYTTEDFTLKEWVAAAVVVVAFVAIMGFAGWIETAVG